jgi:hypothetical protein
MKAYTDICGRRFGFESNRVHVGGEPYVDRWILYLGGLNLRLHKFYRGDDERAPHDHPWWFITFPFTGYWESVEKLVVWPERWGWGELLATTRVINYVKSFRFHFRPATYRHIVMRANKPAGKPWWTFVIAGHRTRLWGFYPPGGSFVPWNEWT